MRLNTRLFFLIHRYAGKYPVIDAFGRAGAEWAIFLMVGWFAVLTYVQYENNPLQLWLTPVSLAMVVFIGLLMSFAIASLVREPRPYIRFPERTTPLFTTYFPSKSFPSDHAFVATAIVVVAWCSSLPWLIPLYGLALWVWFGRIFSGVHTPLDIVAGIILAVVTVMWYGIAFLAPVREVLMLIFV